MELTRFGIGVITACSVLILLMVCGACAYVLCYSTLKWIYARSLMLIRSYQHSRTERLAAKALTREPKYPPMDLSGKEGCLKLPPSYEDNTEELLRLVALKQECLGIDAKKQFQMDGSGDSYLD